MREIAKNAQNETVRDSCLKVANQYDLLAELAIEEKATSEKDV